MTFDYRNTLQTIEAFTVGDHIRIGRALKEYRALLEDLRYLRTPHASQALTALETLRSSLDDDAARMLEWRPNFYYGPSETVDAHFLTGLSNT